jgi:hypothetical protein
MVENNIMITMVMDLVMFAHSTGGKERAHQEWKKLSKERGFPRDEVCGKVINILVLTI